MYEVGTLSESDGVRNGSEYFGSTIYYPINTDNFLASIVIVPGFSTFESSISGWGPFLASHGIVCMTIGTNNIFEQPDSRADALVDAVISLKEENSRNGSPLNSKLDIDNVALGGWSMGGGGAQIAATIDPNIKTIVALCPWLEPNSISSEYLNHQKPILFLSGELDAIAPPDAHANPQYEMSSEDAPKLLFEIGGAGHTIANGPTGGNGEIGIVVLSWLKKYLLEDNCYCPILLETPESASNYTTNISCLPINMNTQEIECVEGWSIISTYINTINTNFSNFISSIISNLVIAKDNVGNAYLPEWDFNGIGDIEQGQAYLIKMVNTVSLAVEGEQIIASENSISLNQGWNLIANFNTEPTNSDASFAALVETGNVIIIKDYIGNALLPEWDFNGLGDLQPGRGYQIKVSANCELQY
jgi:dienelactone hydrolase